MSIFTSGVSRTLRDVHSADDSTARLGRELMTGKKLEGSADGPAAWLAAQRAGSTAGYLDVIHTGLNEAAVNIRVADQTMQAIGEHLKVMQGQLAEAQQYRGDDRQRRHLIADFNTMRQQIDDLVNTTSPQGARNLMTGGDIDVLVGMHGESRRVHGQPVEVGPSGLNLPTLSHSSDLAQAADEIAAAQTALSTRRQALGVDASDIARYLAQNTQIASFYQSHAESLAAADPVEASVQLQSVGVQRSLAVETLGSISNMRTALLELLH